MDLLFKVLDFSSSSFLPNGIHCPLSPTHTSYTKSQFNGGEAKKFFFYLLFTCLLLLWPCWGRSNSNRIAYHSASPLASTKAFFLLSIEITSEKRRGDKMMNEFLNAF